MIAADALQQHFVATGLLGPESTRDDWYRGYVVWLRAGRARIPFPILDRSGPIVLHDLHHMLAGYPPDWPGEIELAGWELGSGGCGAHLLYWLDRLSFFGVGMLTAPRTTLRAFRRGRRHGNLFRRDPQEVPRQDVDDASAFLFGRDAQASPAPGSGSSSASCSRDSSRTSRASMSPSSFS